MNDQPIIVIGAGPAGLGTVRSLADAGMKVVLLDQQQTPGGQLFRGLAPSLSPEKRRVLGEEYSAGISRLGVTAHPCVDYRPGSTVWRIDEDTTVTYTRDGLAASVTGQAVVIATGALERPMPIPGWTQPGVLTAGAAQIMLKAHGVVASRAVLAGSGPLLYLLAVQMIRAGTKPLALVETQTFSDHVSALRHLPRALRGLKTLGHGVTLLRDIRRAGVKRYTGAKGLCVERNGSNTLTFEARGQSVSLNCDHVLLHQGVIPDTQLTRSLGLDHHWHEGQRCFVPTVDQAGHTSLPHVYVVGDGAGIGGGEAAFLRGALLGIDITRRSGVSVETVGPCEKTLRQALDRQQSVRPFIDALYPASDATALLTNETVVCRCEEVTAGAIRHCAASGCIGPNQTKAFSRCGMGPCQGRYCGLTVTRLLADYHGLEPDSVGSYRIRSPIKPITLGELSSLADAKDLEC